MAISENLSYSFCRDVVGNEIEMKPGVTVSVIGENGGDADLRVKEDELGSSNGVMNGFRLHAREVCRRSSQERTADGVVIESVVVINTRENRSTDEGGRDLRAKNDGLGSSDGVLNKDTLDGQETMSRAKQGTGEKSSNSVDDMVPETSIVINSQNVCSQDGYLEVKRSDLKLGKVLEKPEGKMAGVEEKSCVIDVKHSDVGGEGIREKLDGEKVCRICQLSTEVSVESCSSSEGSLENTVARMTTNAHMTSTSMDLMQLGCGCKDELGIAHVHCAEAWFKLKGNRLCEICGQTAKNITGVGDNRFMEEWNEQRYARNYNSSSDRSEGCWRGPPFCNFLMACLVIAFVLPWLFHVDIF